MDTEFDNIRAGIATFGGPITAGSSLVLIPVHEEKLLVLLGIFPNWEIVKLSNYRSDTFNFSLTLIS